MIRVIFVHQDWYTYDNLSKNILNKRGLDWEWRHCFILNEEDEMFLNTGRIGMQLSDSRYKYIYSEDPELVKIFELPISSKWITRKRRSVNPSVMERDHWSQLWRDGYCIPSVFLQGFTCATHVAWLLGLPNYHACDPDDIYEYLVDNYLSYLL